MPELPEVETTRRGIEPYVRDQRITQVLIRDRRFRWPLDAAFPEYVTGQTIRAIDRRGKYLIFRLDRGGMILHLGMSGSLRLVPLNSLPGSHDHIDFALGNQRVLRLRDPRRFGSLHFALQPDEHSLLRTLGPEPLSDAFDGKYLYQLSRGRTTVVKTLLMNSQLVVGIGNIYANEALYYAGIHPQRAAGRISLRRYEFLAQATKDVLQAAIAKGGTTLRDFVQSNGEAGYFRIDLAVYGRAGQRCHCGGTIRQTRLAQRSTYYCARCQR